MKDERGERAASSSIVFVQRSGAKIGEVSRSDGGVSEQCLSAEPVHGR